MKKDIILCTSAHCPYKNRCARQSTKAKEDNDVPLAFNNYEYFCNEQDGFSSYIATK